MRLGGILSGFPLVHSSSLVRPLSVLGAQCLRSVLRRGVDPFDALNVLVVRDRHLPFVLRFDHLFVPLIAAGADLSDQVPSMLASHWEGPQSACPLPHRLVDGVDVVPELPAMLLVAQDAALQQARFGAT